MMRLPVFRLHRPETLPEALELLEGGEGRVRIAAGGTDLYPNLKRCHQAADEVVSLARIAELAGIREDPDGGVRIGAATTLARVAESERLRAAYPAFVRAVESISSPAIRNVATLGGNLLLDTRCTYYNQNEEWRRSIDFCMKEGGTVCWVAPSSPRCWAVSSSDAAPALCALGARVRLASTGGAREIDLPELYRDDGIHYLTAEPGEILTEVIVPTARGIEASFWKLRRRGSVDFAVLSVAAAVRRGGSGTVEEARVWLGAVGSAPVHADRAAAELVGGPLDAERIARAAAAARKAATPLDNTDFTLGWRSRTVVDYVEGALREIAGLPAERLAPGHPV